MTGKWNAEPVPEAKPCPKCGKTPSLRAFNLYTEPYAVCCGGEDCRFYQSGVTRSDAIEKWNAATKNTVAIPPTRTDKFNDREIDHILPIDNSVCRNCEYRKEKYSGMVPNECKECGFLKERNAPYSVGVPVYKEK